MALPAYFALRQILQAGTRSSDATDLNEISDRFPARSPAVRARAARKAGWRCVARGISGAVRSFDGNGSVNTARRTDLYEGVADTIVELSSTSPSWPIRNCVSL